MFNWYTEIHLRGCYKPETVHIWRMDRHFEDLAQLEVENIQISMESIDNISNEEMMHLLVCHLSIWRSFFTEVKWFACRCTLMRSRPYKCRLVVFPPNNLCGICRKNPGLPRTFTKHTFTKHTFTKHHLEGANVHTLYLFIISSSNSSKYLSWHVFQFTKVSGQDL